MCSVILCFCAPADGGGGSESERDQEIQDEEGAEILRHGAILGWAVDHFESVCWNLAGMFLHNSVEWRWFRSSVAWENDSHDYRGSVSPWPHDATRETRKMTITAKYFPRNKFFFKFGWRYEVIQFIEPSCQNPPQVSVVMQRLSYPTETVSSNKTARNRIVLSFKDSPRKPLRRRPTFLVPLRRLLLNLNRELISKLDTCLPFLSIFGEGRDNTF